MGTTGVAFGVEVWPRIFQIVYRDLIDYILIIYAILGVKFTLGANVKQSHETGTPGDTLDQVLLYGYSGSGRVRRQS